MMKQFLWVVPPPPQQKSRVISTTTFPLRICKEKAALIIKTHPTVTSNSVPTLATSLGPHQFELHDFLAKETLLLISTISNKDPSSWTLNLGIH